MQAIRRQQVDHLVATAPPTQAPPPPHPFPPTEKILHLAPENPSLGPEAEGQEEEEE